MQIIGFDQKHTLVIMKNFDSEGLTLMAGNALNGFSTAALMIAFVAALRQRQTEELQNQGSESESPGQSSSPCFVTDSEEVL